MSFEITTAFVENYKSTVMDLLRQQGSRFRDAVTVDDEVVGKGNFTEQVGAGVAVRKTSRHGDTPLTPAEHKRRYYTLFDYIYADLIDKPDRVRTLIDPTNPYVRAGRDAMSHAMDDEVIAAITGTALTGADGTTSVVLPAAQKVAYDYVETGSATPSGLTLAKLRRANKILRAAEALENEEAYIAVGAQQLQDLLADEEVINRNYTGTVEAIIDGKVRRLMGFTFINSQRLLHNTSTDIRTCPCWVPTGVELGIGIEIMGRISERGDKNYSTQVFFQMTLGATRLEEKRVVEISCDESP